MSITTIPLSLLIPSPVNVRKTGGSTIDDLAASIEAHGLIQSLTVRAAEKGKFEVIAGGRRLAALNRLLKEKRNANGEPVTKAFAVHCRVIEDEDATEISLAENAIRQAMHPADQFDAFNALAEGGMGVADIAARFGLPEKHVEQRLKLARVSPKLLAAYREGGMTLEQLEAFTVSDDFKKQEKVWKAVAGTYNRYPANIRQMLTETKVSVTSQKGSFIGEEAYVAAGGTITRDLFAERDATFFDDAELVDRLVTEKLKAEAEKVRAEGWGWVRVFPERFNAWNHDLRELAAPERPMTDEEAATLAKLIEQRDAIKRAVNDEGASTDEQEAEFDRLNDEIDAIEDADRTDWSGFDKAAAGAAVFLDWEGKLSVTRGLVSRDETRTAGDVAESLTLTPTAKPAKPKAEFAAKLLADLSAQRTMAMRAEMALTPAVALDTLVWTLADRAFFNGYSSAHCAKVTLTEHFPGWQTAEAARAGTTMREIGERWRNRLPNERDDLWQWVRDAAQMTKLEMLAYLVATSLDATQANGAPAIASSHAVHGALGLDMANWWEPTGDSYLSRVGKDKVIEAVEEAVSPAAAQKLTKMKKAELVAAAEEKLAGTGWLPKPLRSPEAANDATEAMDEAA